MEITVYSSKTCSQCKMFKNRLEQKGIAFFEIQDEDKAIKIAESVSIYTLPLVEIDGVIHNMQSAAKVLGLC